MTQFFANLAARLSINTVGVQTGVDDATKNIQKFEANVKKSAKESAKAFQELQDRAKEMAISLAGVGAVILETFHYAKEIKDTADAFDITVQSLLGLQKTMDFVGKSGDDVTKMLSKMSVSAEQAKIGNDQLRDAFNKLGISGKEVESLSIDQLFVRVADQLSKTESATTKRL